MATTQTERILESIDWDAISPEGLWTALTIAYPISQGRSLADVSRSLSQRTEWVSERLRELREEIEAQLDPASPPDQDDPEAYTRAP